MIRIMLVDDHTILREALRMVLEKNSEMQVVGEAGDGMKALRLADVCLPDVVVMDVGLPGQSGIETTRQLLASHPNIKVLALSTFLDRTVVQQMLEAGASGYVAKSAITGELIQGIQRVFDGGSYLSSQVASLLADNLRHRQALPDQQLSPRELQIAALLANGQSAREIATQLNISPGTVDTHRRNLMQKLDLHSVVDLTRYAIRTGLIAP
jgi:two-component system NarL family response regulator